MDQSHASTIEAANAALIASGDLEQADAFFTPEYVGHTTERDLTGGPAGVRQFVSMLLEAFSELRVDVEILVESGDRVAWQRTVRGTQTGPFMGFPATNRPVVWRDMLTSRFEDGLIAEEWAVSDLAEALLLARQD